MKEFGSACVSKDEVEPLFDNDGEIDSGNDPFAACLCHIS